MTFGVVSMANEAWIGQEGDVGRTWKASQGLTGIVSGKAVQGSSSVTYAECALTDFIEASRLNADAKHGNRILQQCQYGFSSREVMKAFEAVSRRSWTYLALPKP